MRLAACLLLLLLLLPAHLPWGSTAAGAEGCTGCHREAQRFSTFHDPAQVGCTACHGGNAQAEAQQAAHRGLAAYPGQAHNADRTCGQSGCHADQVQTMRHSIMTTVNGMIELTREAFDERSKRGLGKLPRHRLAERGADSYLRKLCVSCHLANPRTHHDQSLAERGGGCSACHLRVNKPARTEQRGGQAVRTGVHPTLTVRIPNQRCFGCHSRSGRISLNYVGLAEVEQRDPRRPAAFGHLPDGRLVERLAPDVHADAGLSCIDCHTGPGVMGTGAPLRRQHQQLDIACTDCHGRELTEKPVADLTRRELLYPGLWRWTPPDLARGSVVATARKGSALLHVRREGDRRILRKKVFRTEVEIPVLQPGRKHDLPGHARLTCSACHAAWAPQCDGCHIALEPEGEQWDHLQRKPTPGRWVETRWHIRNEAPVLGVTAEDRVAPFVPGMNFVIDLPGTRGDRRVLRYARITPHTTGKRARTCADCHRSERAVGVIMGTTVMPGRPDVTLPLGWVAREARRPAPGLHRGDRSFDAGERARILRVGACLECHKGVDPIYNDYPRSLRAIDGAPHPKPPATGARAGAAPTRAIEHEAS